MSTKRRSWSVEQKLQLIQEADQYGIKMAMHKLNQGGPNVVPIWV